MRYCTKCGAGIPDTSKFCNNCGAAQENDQNAVPASAPPPAPANVTPPNYAAPIPVKAVQPKKGITVLDIIIQLAVIVLMFFDFITLKPGEGINSITGINFLNLFDISDFLEKITPVASLIGHSDELQSLYGGFHLAAMVMLVSIIVSIIAFIVLICGKTKISNTLCAFSLIAYSVTALCVCRTLTNSPLGVFFKVEMSWSFYIVACLAGTYLAFFAMYLFISVLGKTGVSGVLSIVLGTIVIISGFLLSRRDVSNSIVPAVIGLIAGIGIMLIGRLVFVKKNKAKGALISAAWTCRCGHINSQADLNCRACGISRYWTCAGCGKPNENYNTYCTACQKYHG